jgi:hypothetical protein
VQESYDGVGVGGTIFGTYSFFIFKSSICTPKETTWGSGWVDQSKVYSASTLNALILHYPILFLFLSLHIHSC